MGSDARQGGGVVGPHGALRGLQVQASRVRQDASLDGEPRLAPHGARHEEAQESLPDGALREATFDQGPVAQLIVDRAGRVASVNDAARATFGLTTSDVGKPLQDLEIAYRPVELRSLIEQVQNDRRPISAREVSWTPPNGEPRRFDVQLAPLIDGAGRYAGVSGSFTDVSRYHALAAELEIARRGLETAYEELQSTVEELEVMNEELQSMNEQLEAMNEELQSTNEELAVMNDELRDRTDEALHASSFLGSILWSLEEAVVAVDAQLQVTKWSRAATELWDLREDEVEGEHLLNLDIGVPVANLREPIRAVLGGADQPPVTLEGHDRRGHRVRCEVQFAQLRSHLDEVQGAILVMTVEPPDGV